jgi:hypothetical protein
MPMEMRADRSFHLRGETIRRLFEESNNASGAQYAFELHQHPFVSELITRYIDGGFEALLGLPTPSSDFFDATYLPTDLVESPRPKLEVDLGEGAPYAVYEWELRFHFPIAIATQLSKNGHFVEARKWFHYVFDPTSTSPELPPARFWKFGPFKHTQIELIQDVLQNLRSSANVGPHDLATLRVLARAGQRSCALRDVAVRPGARRASRRRAIDLEVARRVTGCGR